MFQIIRGRRTILSFFVDEGLIKLKKGVKIEDAKFEDIENKKNLKFNHQQVLPKTYKTVKEQSDYEF